MLVFLVHVLGSLLSSISYFSKNFVLLLLYSFCTFAIVFIYYPFVLVTQDLAGGMRELAGVK